MRTLGFAVVVVTLLGLLLASLLDRQRRTTPWADRVRFTAHFLLRAYVAVILVWTAVAIASHDGAFRVLLAAVVALFAAWSIFMAGIFAWGVLHPDFADDD